MITDFIHSILYSEKKIKNDFLVLFCNTSITTQIYLKGFVIQDILTNCPQINLTSFNIQSFLKNASYLKRG